VHSRFNYQRAETHPRPLAAQIAPELCMKSVPPGMKRAQGMPGARCTRGLVCKMHKVKHTRAYRFSGGNPAFPARWFYGLFRALPGDRAFLPPSPPRSLLLENLTPASGRQDHTTSPSASSAARLASPKRPPHPAPTFVTTRTPLLSGRDARKDARDLGVRATASGCGRLARRANDGVGCFRDQARADFAGLVGAYAAAIISHRAGE
jgi:hypothetical protein